jgi:hypothetical protein
MRTSVVILLTLLCIHATIGAARAQSAWTLTTADFHADPVVLKAIDAAGAHVTPLAGGPERVVALGDFLEITRPAVPGQPAGKYVLHMVGGDRLGGEPVAIKGDNLVWNSPAVGEIAIPMKRLIALSQPGKPAPASTQRSDVITLNNGDTLSGIVATLGAGKVSVQTDAGSSEVALDSVSAIHFAATPARPTAERAFRVRFADGSAVVVPTLESRGADLLDLTFSKDVVRQVPLSRVTAIEQVNGPVSWLSTRPPAENVYVPYFGNDQLYPARMDADYRGEEIRFHDRRFARGIGVHAYSRLAWNLDGSYAAFRARYAIDGDLPLADVTVRVKLDDKVAYEQQHVRAGTLSPVVLLDLAGAKRITLEVDFGDNGAAQDRLNWIEPALLKTMPPPEPPPPTETPATEPATEPTTEPSPATQPTTHPAMKGDPTTHALAATTRPVSAAPTTQPVSPEK